jgi:hypothetical protein
VSQTFSRPGLACPESSGLARDRTLCLALMSVSLSKRYGQGRQGTSSPLVWLWVPRDSTPVVNWSPAQCKHWSPLVFLMQTKGYKFTSYSFRPGVPSIARFFFPSVRYLHYCIFICSLCVLYLVVLYLVYLRALYVTLLYCLQDWSITLSLNSK